MKQFTYSAEVKKKIRGAYEGVAGGRPSAEGSLEEMTSFEREKAVVVNHE